MEKKNAIDFLLYSYFGVTTESEWKMCVKAAIVKAYNDATMQGAYNALISKDDDKLHEASIEAKNKAARHLYDEIDALFTKGNKEFDDWHGKLCDSIVGTYCEHLGKTDIFTYGNAQKWVNMSIKYICILDLLNHNHDYHDNIEKYMKHFHVPIDNYILQYGKKHNIEIHDGEIKKDDTIYKFKPENDENSYSWSKIPSYEIYKECEEKFHGLSSNGVPLDWEGLAWLEIAEERKKKVDNINSFFKDKNSQE